MTKDPTRVVALVRPHILDEPGHQHRDHVSVPAEDAIVEERDTIQETVKPRAGVIPKAWGFVVCLGRYRQILAGVPSGFDLRDHGVDGHHLLARKVPRTEATGLLMTARREPSCSLASFVHGTCLGGNISAYSARASDSEKTYNSVFKVGRRKISERIELVTS